MTNNCPRSISKSYWKFATTKVNKKELQVGIDNNRQKIKEQDEFLIKEYQQKIEEDQLKTEDCIENLEKTILNLQEAIVTNSKVIIDMSLPVLDM